MLTVERVSQLQDAVLTDNLDDKDQLLSLSREEQLIVNGLQKKILKYATGLNKLINDNK
ncbi:MAG: hypothetical protein IJO70_00525 [Lachnospiraceae bacterium]|nr:hypothetical protein [Lachnospiraceae bacterium]